MEVPFKFKTTKIKLLETVEGFQIPNRPKHLNEETPLFNLSTRNFSLSLFGVSSSLILLFKFLVIFLAACNLYCRKGFTYRPKGIVKDGTKCRPDLSPNNRDICLGGKCMVGYYYNYHHYYTL